MSCCYHERQLARADNTIRLLRQRNEGLSKIVVRLQESEDTVHPKAADISLHDEVHLSFATALLEKGFDLTAETLMKRAEEYASAWRQSRRG